MSTLEMNSSHPSSWMSTFPIRKVLYPSAQAGAAGVLRSLQISRRDMSMHEWNNLQEGVVDCVSPHIRINRGGLHKLVNHVTLQPE